MTTDEFNSLCNRYGIDPEVALENNNVVELLLDIKRTDNAMAKNGYSNCLVHVLEYQF